MTLPGIMIPQAKAVQASSVNKLSADSFGAAEGPKRILITSQEKMGYAFKGIIGICVGPFVGLLGFFIFNLYLKYQKAVASGDTQVIILPLAILEALGGALVMAIGVGLVGFGFYHLYLIFSAKYTCSACNSIWSIDEIECPGCRKRKESKKEWERKYGKRES